MAGPLMLTEFLRENMTGTYTFALIDGAGNGIDPGFLNTLTLTLYDVDANVIVNGRLQQDVLNTNDVTITSDPGPPLETTVTFEIQPEDTVILNQNRVMEYRVMLFQWTWDSGRRAWTHAAQFGVENLLFVLAPTPP